MLSHCAKQTSKGKGGVAEGLAELSDVSVAAIDVVSAGVVSATVVSLTGSVVVDSTKDSVELTVVVVSAGVVELGSSTAVVSGGLNAVQSRWQMS